MRLHLNDPDDVRDMSDDEAVGSFAEWYDAQPPSDRPLRVLVTVWLRELGARVDEDTLRDFFARNYHRLVGVARRHET